MTIKQKTKDNNERGARRQILEDLFDDFYTSRHKVFLMNFVRGISFGFGSILGGTVFVAIIIWILSQLAGWFPPIGESIRDFIITLQH